VLTDIRVETPNALRQCSLALRLEDGDVDLARGQEHAAALKQ